MSLGMSDYCMRLSYSGTAMHGGDTGASPPHHLYYLPHGLRGRETATDKPRGGCAIDLLSGEPTAILQGGNKTHAIRGEVREADDRDRTVLLA